MGYWLGLENRAPENPGAFSLGRVPLRLKLTWYAHQRGTRPQQRT